MGGVGKRVRMRANRAEPHFDIDLEYGKLGERHVDEVLREIACGNGRVEVKRKSVPDEWFYVETHCDYGRRGQYWASGILNTKADTWAIVMGDTGKTIIVPTPLLRQMLDDPSSQDKEERDGNNPTRGRLVSLVVLLFRRRRQLEQLTLPFAGVG